MNSAAVELSSNRLQRAIGGRQTPIDLEIYEPKPKPTEPSASSGSREQTELPTDELLSTKYLPTIFPIQVEKSGDETIPTPPATPKDTSRGSFQSTILLGDDSEEYSLEGLPSLFAEYQSSESGSPTIRAKPRTVRPRLPTEMTGPQSPQNTAPPHTAATPPPERGNPLKHNIDLSYEIDDELSLARVSDLELDESSGLPEASMPNFHFSYQTIRFLAEKGDLNVRRNIAQVCQNFHLERGRKDRALSQVGVLNARCDTLEKDKLEFADCLRKSHDTLLVAMKREDIIKGKLKKNRETVQNHSQKIQKYERKLKELQEGQDGAIKKISDELTLVKEENLSLREKLLAAKQALKMADDAHEQELQASDEAQAKIMADSDIKSRNLQRRLKGQRVIHFFLHIILLAPLIFALLSRVLDTPGLREGLQRLHDVFHDQGVVSYPDLGDQEDHPEKVVSSELEFCYWN
ncbi:hypothetical protein TWF481_010382 [Arthrobotrys musiformis]|uniref:Uncharacterized protein n=1 Tax=Arthrobotrys musiformis TaxID=47236 RepID=A0AAV9W2L9_9PEZI